MSYVKNTWQNGDTVTAEKLNNMENGIAAVDAAQATAFAPNITNPQDEDTLVYDGTAGKWVNGKGGSDFAPDITNPQDGDILVYDGTAGKWVNGAASGGGVVTVGSINLTAMTVSLDKTAGELWTAFKAGMHITATIDDVPPFSVDMAFGLIYASDKGDQGYHFTFNDGENLWPFNAADAQAYPTHPLN